MSDAKRIFVAGHRGMVGSALVRRLEARGEDEIITRSRQDVNLIDQASVNAFFKSAGITHVYLAAARVGGIHANSTYPADFMYKNLMIATNAIEGSYQAGVQRLIFLGSTCIYPKFAVQPIKEESLLTSALEATNEAYAIAKISGLKMCVFSRRQCGVCYPSAMPTNLYGQGDNYHPQNAHVLPALIRRFHEAKRDGLPEVAIWGTGKPLREFLHADDAAAGILHLLQLETPPEWVNLGCGTNISIGNLARLVMKTVGYEGELSGAASKPDGTPRQ